MVLLTDVYRNLTSLWIKPREGAFKQFKSPVLNALRKRMRQWTIQGHINTGVPLTVIKIWSFVKCVQILEFRR